jgi:hypothetical protein
MEKKEMVGWNSSYFGKAKEGSLLDTINNITNKQNDMVGGKPEVADSQIAAAQKEQQAQKEGAMKRGSNLDTYKPRKEKHKKEENDDEATDKIKKSDKGPVKVHGENYDAVRDFKVSSMKAALAKVYGEALKDDDKPEVKDVIKGLKKASDTHAAQAKNLEKQIDDEGNAFGKALMAAKEKGEKTFTVAGKKYNVEDNTNDKSDDGDGLDKVQPKAVKKKFADRKDKDIDNDGDVDSSDKYLHKRRKAISKAIK